jgi:dGTPase
MPMEWACLLSSKRLRNEGAPPVPEDGRSEFQKDYDRIVFSRPFRRLQGKTQVHPLPDNDHVHTRLTHTLEVASVGRSLGARVGIALQNADNLPPGICPPDLGSILQAACLAHDIGNPPFGHAGEEAIRGWFHQNPDVLKGLNDLQRLDLQNFEGNAQGLRVLTQLEGHLFSGGLRPTFATLGTFIKYPWCSGHSASIGKRKFGFFQTEREVMGEIASELGLIPIGPGSWVRHPLVFLVEAADDICYAIVDLEDAHEMGILPVQEIDNILTIGLTDSERIEYATLADEDPFRRLGYLRGKVVDYLVHQVTEAFSKNEERILNGEFDGELVLQCEEKAAEIVQKAKLLAHEMVFVNPRKVQIEIGAYSIIDVLLREFCTAYLEVKEARISFKARHILDLLGVNAPGAQDSVYPALIRITDFVSGCTDKYAAQLSQRLSGTAF